MSVVIIDYGSGNLHSAKKAFERASHESGLNIPVIVSSSPDVVKKAERIVLPGVGAFADCRKGLDGVSGMVEALTESVKVQGKPFLGICVGMQLLATRGLEHKTTQGLNWIEGDVALIRPQDTSLKIPHMGWNNLHLQQEHVLLKDIPLGPQGLHAYFVHSYAIQPKQMEHVVAVSSYGGPVTAMVAHNNIAGTQFHPEKSQSLGLALISNFLKWRP